MKIKKYPMGGLKITGKFFKHLKSKLVYHDKFTIHELVVCLSEITYEYSKNLNGEIDIERI
jgi:hypothetical protein